MKEALLYKRLDNNKVRCLLCNHRCVIPPGGRGVCKVRYNKEGILFSLVYGRVVAQHVDPIEKKPLFHFLPGSKSFSLGTIGCNFQCDFCQNFEISQSGLFEGDTIPGEKLLPEDIVKAALMTGSKTISYTYNEPTVFFEFALDCSSLAVKENLRNVWVSNGYISNEALELLVPFLHAANIDLKAFRESFYKKHCRARLAPVLETLKYLKQHNVWLEVTTLIIPQENDDPQELKDIASFISKELGADTPWHVTRFYPQFQLLTRPPTPLESLQKAYKIGKEEGLKYVYIGNVAGGEKEKTFCWNCGQILIDRYGFNIIGFYLTAEGKCPHCGAEIHGVWE